MLHKYIPALFNVQSKWNSKLSFFRSSILHFLAHYLSSWFFRFLVSYFQPFPTRKGTKNKQTLNRTEKKSGRWICWLALTKLIHGTKDCDAEPLTSLRVTVFTSDNILSIDTELFSVIVSWLFNQNYWNFCFQASGNTFIVNFFWQKKSPLCESDEIGSFLIQCAWIHSRDGGASLAAMASTTARGLGLDGLSIGCWQKKRGLFRSPQSTYWAWPPQTELGTWCQCAVDTQWKIFYLFH